MDIGKLNLFLKMITEEYKLTEMQLETLTHRLLADDIEFEKVWNSFKNKHSSYRGGVDDFKFLLHELIR